MCKWTSGRSKAPVSLQETRAPLPGEAGAAASARPCVPPGTSVISLGGSRSSCGAKEPLEVFISPLAVSSALVKSCKRANCFAIMDLRAWALRGALWDLGG